MAQIRSGLVNVENGSSVVTSVGANWSTVLEGDIFLVRNNNVPYFVSSVSYVGSQWQLTLSAPYMQQTATSQQYAIANSFTSIIGLPLISPGDVETATIFTRAMAMIDEELSSLRSQIEALESGAAGTITVVSETGDGAVLSVGSSLIVEDTDDSTTIDIDESLIDSETGDSVTLIL